MENLVPALTMVPQEDRKKLKKLIAGYRGAITEIAERVAPPVHRTTVTLWFAGRVQSARLDYQIPRCISDFLKDRAGEVKRRANEMEFLARFSSSEEEKPKD